VGPFGKEVINDNGDKLIDVCEQTLIKILNAYFKHNKIQQYTWHQDTSVHMAPRYSSTHGTKTHQYTWHQDTAVHMAPRYTGDKLHNRLHHCQKNSGLQFQDVRIFRGMTVGSNHY
jgi:hypothetical protein